MKVVNNGIDTLVGPPDWFAGHVYIDPISAPSPTSRIMGGVVHFAPGARTAWHTHPAGQTVLVTEGISLFQRAGGSVEEVRPGDRVSIAPGENHWHGATATCFTTQIAYQEADDAGHHTTWGRHVTDEEYAG